jgi:hypothetical protein
MMFITFANLWSFSVFFLATYLTLVVSVVTYVLPIISSSSKYSTSVSRSSFSFVNAQDLFWVFATPYIILIAAFLVWTGPSLSAWFGHLVYTSFQAKMGALVSASFIMCLAVLTSTTYFSSREIYDYVITTFNFAYWIFILFMVNSVFTTIFVIEVLSALIFLLIITSTFSTAYFYRNTNLSFGHLFQHSTPFTYLQAVLFFFWVSLISSLNLFLFCLLFYTKIPTFDWYLVEYIFVYFTNASTSKEIYTLCIAWFVLIFCLFLKCGLAPLYVWKPTFFKGVPVYTLFFYICFFYFFLFLFVINLLTSYFAEVFYYYSLVVTLFVLIGLFTLLTIVCESYYIKAFLAISSILNSLFVILALSTSHVSDLPVWL